MSDARIVLARLLLLLIAASALAAGAASALRDRRVHEEVDRYVCPMHPEVKSGERGACPICGMALEPNGGRGAADIGLAKSPDFQAVENIRKHKILDFVRLRALPVDQRERYGAAWVDGGGTIQAVFYRDQVDGIPTGEKGSFSPSALPTVKYGVRRSAAAPESWDTSTARVAFESDAASDGVAPRPGQVGWVTLEPRTRAVLAVPASAVLQSAEGPYVLKSVGGFRFAKQRIEVGETFVKQGFAVVLSGLHAQDRVVARAAFFLDASRRAGNPSASDDWGSP